jgi:hypothetical protein
LRHLDLLPWYFLAELFDTVDAAIGDIGGRAPETAMSTNLGTSPSASDEADKLASPQIPHPAR